MGGEESSVTVTETSPGCFRTFLGRGVEYHNYDNHPSIAELQPVLPMSTYPIPLNAFSCLLNSKLMDGINRTMMEVC